MEIRSGYVKDNKMMMAMRASWVIAHPVKRTIIYSLAFLLPALLLAWLFTLNIKWGFSDYVKKILYVSALLLIGIIHIYSFPKWLAHILNQDGKVTLLYSLLLTGLIGVSTFLLFGFVVFENPQLAIAGACSFLLPAAILQSWNYFDSISSKTYPPWFLPCAMPPQKKTTIFLNSLQVRIKLKKNYFDIEESLFMVTVPGRLLLGNMFHQFVMEREGADAKIQLADMQQNPYAWKFLLQKALGTVVLDPEASLLDNNIKQNDIIRAERIKGT